VPFFNIYSFLGYLSAIFITCLHFNNEEKGAKKERKFNPRRNHMDYMWLEFFTTETAGFPRTKLV